MKFLSAALTAALFLGTGQSALAERNLFRFQGLDFSHTDLPIELQQAVSELEADYYRNMEKLLEGAALDAYFRDAAKTQNKPLEIVMQEALLAGEPSEDDVKKFYDENKDRLTGEYSEIKPQLIRYLQSQGIEKNRTDLLAKIKKEHHFEMLLPEPEVLAVNIHSEGYPQKGHPDAKVHIVEFADYQCPHCKHASDALKTLIGTYQDKIKLTYMDYPVNRSGISQLVAEGGVCADQQGKYWEYHELAFSKQNELSKDTPTQLASELKLDEKAFADCLSSEPARQKVAASKAEAMRLGLNSTPAVFINGKRVHLYDLNTDLTTAIDKALKVVE